MSCNGCRVLRKGCSESCILRPCLQWIDSADAQGHATVFVAKFFGRSGLMGFISAVPPNQRPAVFQSLLYEACGRTVNPVFGAVGLLFSGNWVACQAAVETVLKGGSLRPPSPSSLEAGITSFPNFPVGNPFPRTCYSVQLPVSTELEKPCPTDTSGLSLSNDMPDFFSKAIAKEKEIVKNALMEYRKRENARCSSEVITGGSYQTQMHAENMNNNVESRASPAEMKGDSAEFLSERHRQLAFQGYGGPSLDKFPRLVLPTVAACRGMMGVEKQEQDDRTDGPVVVTPVARRVRPRMDVSEVRAPSAAPVARVDNEERENLELDLTLSSNVNATKQQRNVNGGVRAKGMKRVASPNSSESVNSEGSVTSSDTCLSLSRPKTQPQVSTGWKHSELRESEADTVEWKSKDCQKLSDGISDIYSNNSRKALSLFASP